MPTKKHTRPSWDEYFMGLVDAVAKRGTCDRGQAGSIAVRDKLVLVTGYVGSPAGAPHCDDVGHLIKTVIHEDGSRSRHCLRTVHSEQNVICQAAKNGIALKDATIYTRMTPCRTCAMLLVNSGVKEVVCQQQYHAGQEAIEIFKAAGVGIRFLDDRILPYEDQ